MSLPVQRELQAVPVDVKVVVGGLVGGVGVGVPAVLADELAVRQWQGRRAPRTGA